jgi:hypothetical protein
MNGFIDIENDIFQAHCAVDYLQNHIEEGATIRHVRDDVVTLDLSDGSETEINLEPIQSLLNGLRRLT